MNCNSQKANITIVRRGKFRWGVAVWNQQVGGVGTITLTRFGAKNFAKKICVRNGWSFTNIDINTISNNTTNIEDNLINGAVIVGAVKTSYGIMNNKKAEKIRENRKKKTTVNV